jgi:hypothetical protein
MVLRAALTALVAALVAAAPAAPAAAAGPEITDLDVAVDGNRALVRFRLAEGFGARLVERVRSGLPTGFVYQLELLKDRKRWYDRPLAATTLQVTAMYDAVSGEYLVNTKLGGKLVESRMATTLGELERALTEVRGLPAFALDPFPRSWRLLVRVRAELGGKTVLFFPARETTDWRESDKFRSPNVLPEPE